MFGSGLLHTPSEDPTPTQEQGNVDVAAAAALARVRDMAASQGFRPVSVRRRRRPRVRRSEAGPSGRDPRLLGDQLEALVVAQGWRLEVNAGTIMGRWPSIVGEGIAEHCEAVSFADGVLTVRADSSAWASNLRLMASSLVARLNEAVPNTVDEVVVEGPRAAPRPGGHRRWGSRRRSTGS